MTRHPRVLIVDDNPDHRFLIERALRRLPDVSLEIMTAGDGEEAMEVLRGNGEAYRPHVMLLDLRMPRRSAWRCWPRSSGTRNCGASPSAC